MVEHRILSCYEELYAIRFGRYHFFEQGLCCFPNTHIYTLLSYSSKQGLISYILAFEARSNDRIVLSVIFLSFR